MYESSTRIQTSVAVAFRREMINERHLYPSSPFKLLCNMNQCGTTALIHSSDNSHSKSISLRWDCVGKVEWNAWSWERTLMGLQSVCLNSREPEPIHQQGNLISTMCPMQMNSARNQAAVVLPIVAEKQEGR